MISAFRKQIKQGIGHFTGINPLTIGFLVKISFINPYLKILDLLKLFVANALMTEKNPQLYLVLLPLRVLWNKGLKICYRL